MEYFPPRSFKNMALLSNCVYRLTLCRRFRFAIFKNYRKHSTCSIKQILLDQKIGQGVCVKGWIKGIQQHKGVTFLHVNDGSGSQSLQIVLPQTLARTTEATFGSCVEVQGVLQKSPAKKQHVELVSTSINVLGSCNPSEFPIKQRARHPPQYTRDFLHLRPKTNVFSALLRIRSVASMAVHSFFQPLKHDILTSSNPLDGDNDDIGYGPQVIKNCDEFSSASKGRSSSNDFFSHPSFLTVSGQLHLEVITGAFTKVYNFGPVFRAENSLGSYHLSEFYMVEAELAFVDKLEPLLMVMEELFKSVCTAVINECPEDVESFLKYVAPTKHMSSINRLMESKFERLSYTDAIHILENSKEDFQYKVCWGCDLKKEHEMYLTKAVGNIPVFVTDYPADIKPFYARKNNDGSTVAASDLLVPGVGEVCGSSLREERADILEEVMISKGLIKEIPWYLEIRKFGSCSHGGFGLGFERLLMALLGSGSLKDVIPFPRWPRNCKT